MILFSCSSYIYNTYSIILLFYSIVYCISIHNYDTHLVKHPHRQSYQRECKHIRCRCNDCGNNKDNGTQRSLHVNDKLFGKSRVNELRVKVHTRGIRYQSTRIIQHQ